MSVRGSRVKCGAAVMAFLLACQPCVFDSEAKLRYGYGYDWDDYGDYPSWDDPYYYEHYYEDSYDNPKVEAVDRTYEDGSRYTAEYKYNEQGDMIYADIREPGGDRTVLKRTYQGAELKSISNYTYETKTKEESTQTVEFRENETPTHGLFRETYADGTSQTDEIWYAGEDLPQKHVRTNPDGTTEQVEYTYDDAWNVLSISASASNGSVMRRDTQYDGDKREISYREYGYDAETQITDTKEVYYGDGYALYVIEVRTEGGGETTRTETWYRSEDQKREKVFTVMPDGIQYTETYAYDKDGNETLYIGTGSDGSSKRFERIHLENGEKSVYSDSAGNSSVKTATYDEKSGVTKNEETEKDAYGTSTYRLTIYNNWYNITYSMVREKYADGTEAYEEYSLGTDGSSTKKQKAEDGTLVVKVTGADGKTVSNKTTYPDGRTAETTEIIGDDGTVMGEVKQYSDGTSDRSDYEYGENGEMARITETRSNGVVGICDISEFETRIRFNNGYETGVVLEAINEELTRTTVTYAGGEIASEIIEELEDDGYRITTVYRDGRVEESVFSGSDETQVNAAEELIDQINDRYVGYQHEAWTVVPQQEEGEPV